MKVAIFSDIHGNREALISIIKDINLKVDIPFAWSDF